MKNFKYKAFLNKITIYHLVYKLFIVFFILGSYIALDSYYALNTRHFDTSTMHQPTYNTFRAIQTRELGRILEMTDPHENRGQVSRLSFHFDPILIVLSLFYFVHAGPETLFIVKVFFLGLAIFPLYKISILLLKDHKDKELYSLLICAIYTLYLPTVCNLFISFHPVDLAPAFLLYMTYYSFNKQYLKSIVFCILTLMLKENIGLTVAAFGFVQALKLLLKLKINKKVYKTNNQTILNSDKKTLMYMGFLVTFGLLAFFSSLNYVIPFFRDGNPSFYSSFFSQYGSTPLEIIVNIIINPKALFARLISAEVIAYFVLLNVSLLFLPIISPAYLTIIIPEFLINALSTGAGMVNGVSHYNNIITPFIVLAFVYGFNTIIKNDLKNPLRLLFVSLFISFGMSFLTISSLHHTNDYFLHLKKTKPNKVEFKKIMYWEKKLNDENIRIAASPYISPLVSSRRYLYLLDPFHTASIPNDAEYVLLTEDEFTYHHSYPNYREGNVIKIQTQLNNENKYKLVDQVDSLKIYKAF